MKKIIGAKRRMTGTTFYEIEPDVFLAAILDADDGDINIWHKYLAKTQGLESLDIDHMYGSRILKDADGDDALYFCETDGEDIEVDGKQVDPEDALDDYSLEALDDYLEGTAQGQVLHLINDSDFKTPDFDKEIVDALESYDFVDLAEAYVELTETR
jgi:hypothetical protein